jgi:hypothetical protein
MGVSIFFILYYRGSLVRSTLLFRTTLLLLLFTIVIGVHGISHAILEKEYNFYPPSMRASATWA